MKRWSPIRAVLFDFGGVLAEEGFKAGLSAIALKKGLNPEQMIQAGFDIVYDIGFVTGRTGEAAFWKRLRERIGFQGNDRDLSEEILSRFMLRPQMLDIVSDIKERGIIAAILSDQTHWLDELNSRSPFFHLFDYVFNSYHLGVTKKDPAIFDQVIRIIDCPPQAAVFVDDHLSHVQRARSRGLHGIYYTVGNHFLHQLYELLDGHPFVFPGSSPGCRIP